MAGLVVVPTPIGNLDDMTFRAIKVLKDADFILAEDTRTSGKLLSHFEIKNKLYSFHKFNEHKTVENFVNRIESGETCALISDAGTPGISDPGYLLIHECVKNGIKVECLPGATAFVPALVCSGLPCDKFFFEGFLPQKKGRQKRLQQLAELPCTVVMYESPYRLVKLLEQISEFVSPDKYVSVSREISKMYEETYRGTATEVLAYFKSKTVKGEIVVVMGDFEKEKSK